MNTADGVGLGQRQEIVIAFDVDIVRGQQVAAKIRLFQAELLDHGAHGAVEDENPLPRQRLQLFRTLGHGAALGSGAAARMPRAWQIARVSSARFRV